MTQIGNIKLKNCTCGNRNMTVNGYFSERKTTKWVCCWICNSVGPEELTDKEAAMAWNCMQADRRVYLTGTWQ